MRLFVKALILELIALILTGNLMFMCIVGLLSFFIMLTLECLREVEE